VSSVVVFPTDVIYVNRGVVHPTDHYKIVHIVQKLCKNCAHCAKNKNELELEIMR